MYFFISLYKCAKELLLLVNLWPFSLSFSMRNLLYLPSHWAHWAARTQLCSDFIRQLTLETVADASHLAATSAACVALPLCCPAAHPVPGDQHYGQFRYTVVAIHLNVVRGSSRSPVGLGFLGTELGRQGLVLGHGEGLWPAPRTPLSWMGHPSQLEARQSCEHRAIRQI